MVLFLRSKKGFRYIPENESEQPVLGWNKSHAAFEKECAKGGGVPQLLTEELNGYFRSLANATTTEKDTLSALVKINTTLATSNATLTTTVADLQKAIGDHWGGYEPPQRSNLA